MNAFNTFHELISARALPACFGKYQSLQVVTSRECYTASDRVCRPARAAVGGNSYTIPCRNFLGLGRFSRDIRLNLQDLRCKLLPAQCERELCLRLREVAAFIEYIVRGQQLDSSASFLRKPKPETKTDLTSIMSGDYHWHQPGCLGLNSWSW